MGPEQCLGLVLTPSELCQRGAALLEGREPKAAMAMFDRAAAASPRFAMAQLGRASALLALGLKAPAVVAAEQAARLGEADAGLLFRVGRCLRDAGAAGAAVVTLRRAVAIEPRLAEAWYALGLLLGDARRHGEAAQAFRAALRARPGLHEAAFNLGVARAEAGDLEGALDAYAAALRSRPESFGRIAQALVSAPTGCLWLDPAELRRVLVERGGALV